MSNVMDMYVQGGRSRKTAERQHRSSRAKSSVSGPGGPPAPLSFLFVVNELDFYNVDGQNDVHRDDWYNTLPPRNCYGYTDEHASRVMRYAGGQVTEARDYQWFRPGLCQPGHCFSPAQEPLHCYSDLGVFSCGPHLPVVLVAGDPMTTVDGRAAMHALRFFHPAAGSELRGVSQATWAEGNMPHGGFPVRYVAGRDPSWIPSLVPRTFRNPDAGVSSRGLGGELPIVLGLMAFSEAGGRADEVFLGRNGHRGRWRDRVWMNSNEPQRYMRAADDEPRGFYVAVFNDPQNAEGSTDDRIYGFEWQSVIVKEHPSGSSSSKRS